MKSIRCNGNAIQPSKIICVGRNYAEHIEELRSEVPEETVFFIKPNSALSETIHLCTDAEVHYEGEISFLVSGGRVVAVGFGLDLTKREVQRKLKAKGLPWERAKAFDRSAVFSDFVSYTGDLLALRMELLINGVLVQAGQATEMLNSPARIFSEIKPFLSLEDGDVIMTGTPKGVGPIHVGDKFQGNIYENDRLLVTASWVVQEY